MHVWSPEGLEEPSNELVNMGEQTKSRLETIPATLTMPREVIHHAGYLCSAPSGSVSILYASKMSELFTATIRAIHS